MELTGAKIMIECLKKEGVEAIFGLVYSSTRSAVAANVADRYKTPYFYPTYNEGGVCGRYFVNLGALPNQQLDFFIPYLMERFGKSFYFVGQDYVWPRESIKYCEELITANGGTMAGTEFVAFGTTDWGPAPVLRLRSQQGHRTSEHPARRVVHPGVAGGRPRGHSLRGLVLHGDRFA